MRGIISDGCLWSTVDGQESVTNSLLLADVLVSDGRQ